MAIKRRSNITAKFAKMRGLEVDEKRVFTRMGELIDAVINNRTPGNPGAKAHRTVTRTDASLPPPAGLSTYNGVRSAKISWPPVNSSYLQFYEVRLTDLNTGDETTHACYSNTYTVKDKEGDFQVAVRTVGRDGTCSTFTTTTFSIMPSVIIYDGEKNLPDELGWVQGTSVYTPKGYNVFFWSSMVLDSFSDPEYNTPLSIKMSVHNAFYQGGDFYLFDKSISSTEGFGEEVTFTNLSTAAGGGSTARPGGSPVRTSCSQTTKAFSHRPYTVPKVISERYNSFWITESNRDDIIGLSFNTWVSTAGVYIVEGLLANPIEYSLYWPQPVLPWPGQEDARLEQYDYPLGHSFGLSGNQMSFLTWFKFETPSTPLLHEWWIWNHTSVFDTVTGSALSFSITKDINDMGTPQGASITVAVGGKAKIMSITSELTLDTWHQLVVSWNTGTATIIMDGVNLGILGTATPPAGWGTPTSLWNPLPSTDRIIKISGSFIRGFFTTYENRVKLFETIIWSAALTDTEVAYLYSGISSSLWNQFDFKQNSGLYTNAGNVIHWWAPGGTAGFVGDTGSVPISLVGNGTTSADLVVDYPA